MTKQKENFGRKPIKGFYSIKINSIKKLKKKKAAEMDEIPNEVWIFGKENVTKDREVILNNIRKKIEYQKNGIHA